MARIIISLIAGSLFGLGLVVSEMVNPARVLGFLDIAGTWDPTLAFVLAGALSLAIPGYWIARRRARPFFDERSHVPEPGQVDRRLIIGAVLFGIGWGLAGFCPGPAITALGTGRSDIILFFAAMTAGMWVNAKLAKK